ncbi:MAG: glucose-1-phosphate adenylyltransferase subunit GlgD [Eubacteriales bacterium]
MCDALGIITSSANRLRVEGLQDYRPMGAFSFAGRYRVIDFPISNMSNSEIDRIQVYVRENPRSLAEHLSNEHAFNINSKKGKLQVLFSNSNVTNDIYNTDVAAFAENLDIIARSPQTYVVLAPSYMIYTQDYNELLKQHIESGADITCLYQHVNNAKDHFLNCNTLTLNKQKGVLAVDKNRGTAQSRNISLNTYVMKKDLFVDLIQKSQKYSSVYTMAQTIDEAAKNDDYDVRGVLHKGYLATCSDFKSYYEANMDMLNLDVARNVFNPSWPIYTVTTDSAPTNYFETGSASNSLISNGCTIRGHVENSIIGRGVTIEEGAVVKNSVVLAYSKIGKGVEVDYQVVDKWAQVIHLEKVIGTPEKPGYIRRSDII